MLLLHRIADATTHPADASTRCPELLASWLRHAPRSNPDPHCDFEDWAEPAHMLMAMERHGAVVLLPSTGGVRMTGDRTARVPADPGAPDAVMWGTFRSGDSRGLPVAANLLWNGGSQVSTVQRYASSPVFLRHAGRSMRVCDFTSESIAAAISELRDAGHQTGFIKTRDKGMARPFAIPSDVPAESLCSALDGPGPDDMFWMGWLHREGDRKAIFVQSVIRPTREYRVLVVGDRPVTGAGCVEAHTPCDNEGVTFDPKIEIVRNRTEISSDPELAERYRAFAVAYAAEWAAEHGSDMGYSLDLCVDAADEAIKVIEMNPLANIGLYATNPNALVDAMVGSAPDASAG